MRTFNSGRAFAAFLLRMAAAEQQAVADGLAAAAKIVEDEAKASFGHYQARSGPFRAWAALADSTKRDRVRKGFPEDAPLLRTGHERDTIETRVSGNDAFVGSDSKVLAYLEFGTEKMPPRRVLGGAAARKAREVGEAMTRPTLDLLAGKRN